MINDGQPHNIPEIRKLLTITFDDPGLNALCQDHFPEVYDKLSRGMRKDEKITLLLDHCRHSAASLDKLLGAVRGYEPPLVSREVSNKSFSDLLFELGEWKLIHNDLHELLNALNVPLEYLTLCRFRPNPDMLDQAGYKWQELCVPKLRSVPERWNLRYAYTPVLESLREQTLSLDGITRQLMQTDVNDPGFRPLYFQLVQLKGVLWDVLTVADKKIMLLVEKLQPMIGV